MVSKLDDQVGRVIKPAERADTPHSILVKTYTGKQGEATALFQAACIEMATQAYFPTWQSWTPGEWARETYIFAVLLIPLFGIGILRLAYLLIVEPDGTLTVTYERRPAPVEDVSGASPYPKISVRVSPPSLRKISMLLPKFFPP